jgi:hypothetical protein
VNQPVPRISEADVERVVHRDYPPEVVPVVLAALQEYGAKSWHNEPARVRLAVLRLADGHLEKLHQELAVAKEDYRDVLAVAEYPEYFRAMGWIDRNPQKRQEIIAADLKQYQDWVQRK